MSKNNILFFKKKTKISALSFDGVNEYANIDTALTPLKTTTVGTWMAWFKPEVLTNGEIIAFGDTDANSFIQINPFTDSKVYITVLIGGVTKWQLVTTNAVLSVGVWTHISIVQNSVSPVLYINGNAVAQSFSVSADKTTWFNSISGLDNGRIACKNINSAGNTNFINGRIADAAFFNTNLTAAQIVEAYNNRKPHDFTSHSAYSNLVAFYRFNNTSFWDGTNFQIPEYKARLENKKSILFDGVAEAVNIDAVFTALSATTQGTWSAWVRLVNVTAVNSDYIIVFGDTDANTTIELTRQFTDAKLRAIVIENGSARWRLETTAAAFSNNTWTHIALVQNGVSPVLYVNGVAVAQSFITSTDKTEWFNSVAGLDNGRISCRNSNNAGNNTFLNGNTDEVRFYNTALTAAQILALYNNGSPAEAIAPLTDENLVAKYRMGDAPLDSNTVIEDVYGNNDGVGINLEAADLEYRAPLLAVSVNIEQADLITENIN